MVHLNCPWCEAEQRIELSEIGDEFVCPDCMTRVLLADDSAEPDLALAA